MQKKSLQLSVVLSLVKRTCPQVIFMVECTCDTGFYVILGHIYFGHYVINVMLFYRYMGMLIHIVRISCFSEDMMLRECIKCYLKVLEQQVWYYCFSIHWRLWSLRSKEKIRRDDGSEFQLPFLMFASRCVKELNNKNTGTHDGQVCLVAQVCPVRLSA